MLIGSKTIMNPEFKTIKTMVWLYCSKRHGEPLCSDCEELLEYARLRIEKCPFGAEKPTCENCTVHCYKPAMRERVKEVMRFSGPRMLTRHPVLVVRHLIRSKLYSGRRSK